MQTHKGGIRQATYMGSSSFTSVDETSASLRPFIVLLQEGRRSQGAFYPHKVPAEAGLIRSRAIDS